jgi:ABC-2 type transport system ATP-binding protein
LPAIEVSHVSKSFGPIKAVEDVSFSVETGEIFGLLGPNGAGKTTIIRLALDIFKPDEGRVAILDGPMSEAKKERIGYMPEERGLYQDARLERMLVYLATLKGVSPPDARQRVGAYLERFDLLDYRRKKVKDLSKGMQQKAQIIATLIHQPELIIIDEPFSGLDPINTQLVKELLMELHRGGATIVMSTHQMHQVEELCDRILLVHHGHALLYGALDDIRGQFSGHAVLVRAATELPDLPGVILVEKNHRGVRLDLDTAASPQAVLQALIAANVPVEKFEIAAPTLDEIFVQVVQAEGERK